MMTMNKSSQWKTLRALAVVPVIALALLAFANTKSVAAVVTASVQQNNAVQSEMPSSEPVKAETAPVTVETNTEVQTPQEPVSQSNKVYETVEQLPEFPGGLEALIDFLSSNVHYPENAVKNNIEGRVLVQFIVDKTGQVTDVKVARSVDEELDAEAVRVAKMLPRFEPGRQDGKPVSVWYTLPIVFKLQGDEKPAQKP